MDDEQEQETQGGDETPEATTPEQTPQDDVTGEAPGESNAKADADKIAKLTARMDAIEAGMQEIRNMINGPSDAINDMAEDTDDYGTGDDGDYDPETITVADLFKTA